MRTKWSYRGYSFSITVLLSFKRGTKWLVLVIAVKDSSFVSVFSI